MRDRAIDIMYHTFDENPAVAFTIGIHGNYSFRKRRLATFMYDFCNRRKGVRLSDNRKGIICFYEKNAPVSFLATAWDELCVGLFAIGPFRLARVLKRSRLVRQRHQLFPNYIHCWYLGVELEHRDMKTAIELKHLLIKESASAGLPILAETTMLQNKTVYERIGFKTYDIIDVNGLKTYCMVYQADTLLGL